MSKKTLLVLFGGKSSEHEISCISAYHIIKNICKDKYTIITVGISKTGDWLLYEGKTENIKNCTWQLDPKNKKIFVSPSPSYKQIIVYDNNSFGAINIDVIFPVLHGKNGEDGTVQGLLEISEIPFVGCGTCSSAICMDKVITCVMLSNSGIDKPNFYWFFYDEFMENKIKIIDNIESVLGKYPYFVKPANSGSSVGLSKAHDREELISSINIAKDHDKKILIEQSIEGKEVECAVIGNEAPITSSIGEIEPSNEFYDFDAKYTNNSSKLYIPARISDSLSKEIRSQAIKAYKIMGCKGLARIDFLVRGKDNKIFLNEINTLPGFTSISMYPKLMENIGISFPNLINKLIEYALIKSDI